MSIEARWPGLMTLVIFALITVVGFLSWVFGLILLWLILRAVGLSASPWAMIEALSTAVAAAAVLSGGFVAYRELSEIANTRYMEVADRLFQELNSTENIEARRWVFQELPADPAEGLSDLSQEGQRYVKRVLNSLDRVAFLTQAGWIPDDLIMPWMHPMIAKSWSKLAPYVRYEQQRRNEPYYYEHAATLAERCATWRESNVPDTEIRWLEDAL